MWLDKQVSLYECAADNIGRAATYRSILLTQYAMEHKWYVKTYPEDKETYPKGKWENGTANDLFTICNLNSGKFTKAQQVALKQTMQCYTPAALLKTKKKGAIEEINRTGIMQLDFDYNDIKEYDIEELKRAVFKLPFVAFCGLSCSGLGFYALVSIAEPNRLNEYAEHCFEVLLKYGIKADTSKGRNAHDLRFVSYDCNMLINEDPQPLLIKCFKPKQLPVKQTFNTYQRDPSNSNIGLLNSCIKKLGTAGPGNRMNTVKNVAHTLGGTTDHSLLQEIINYVKGSSIYTDDLESFIQCAKDCFKRGLEKPLEKRI